MDLFNLLARITLDKSDYEKQLGVAEKNTKNFGKKIKTGIKKTAKVVAAGIGVASGAVVKLSKDSLEAYADYEQLVGGVETLFGAGGKSLEEYAKSVGKSTKSAKVEYEKLETAQTTVLNNAKEAYINAGLSQNDYLETVTSFSASLIASLEGDTVKAADVADKAIVDMSDNANKMGTSMEAVSNAYRGFSRGNFTMLDNLALGFAGTKEGMQELLDKAQEISGIKYDISSYSDIVQAIHVVQTEMGITGTTAKEAASTISGSFGMLKGAWSNLISGLMDENANIPDLVSDVTESAVTLFDNVKPKIKQFFDAIPEAIHNMLAPYPEVQSTVDGVIQGIKNIATTASNTVKFIVDNWNVIAPILAGVAAAVGAITGAITIYNAVMAVKTAMDAAQVTSLGALIAAKWADFAATAAVLAPYALIVAAIAAVIAIIVLCVKHWDEIKEKVVEVAGKIKDAVANAFEKVSEFFKNIWESITSFFSSLFTSIGEFFKSIYDAIVKFFEDPFYYIGYALGYIIGMIVKFFTETIPNAWEDFKKWFNETKEKVKAFFVSLPEKFKDWFMSMKQKITDFWNDVKEFFPKAIESVSNFLKNAGEKAKQGAKDLFDNIVNGIKNLPEKLKEIGKNLVEGLWNGLNDKIQWLKDQIKGFANGITQGIKDALGIHSPSIVFRREVGENLALGLGEGFEDEMADVEKRMQKAIPTDFDIAANVNGSVSGANGTNAAVASVVQAMVPELYSVIVHALQDGVKIQWKERELARLVKTYAN